MKKSFSTTILILLIVLSTAGCGQKNEAVQPAAEPVLVERPPLPSPLVVKTSQRLDYRLSPNGPPQDFGKSIALGEDVLAVGAPDRTSGDMGANGSVFVYRQQGDQWVEETRLYSSDQEDGFQYKQGFGSALAFSGDLLFVGAPEADDLQVGDNSGAVYVFQDGNEGWQEIARLAPQSPRANVRFGTLLSVYGDTLVVGEGYEGTQLHIFLREGEAWNLQSQLDLPLESGARPNLGSLALYGDSLAVSLTSIIGEGEQAQTFGHLLLYEHSGTTWGEPVELFPGESGYGQAAALDGNGEQATRLALSFMPGSQPGADSGGILIYERKPSGWEQSDFLTLPDDGGFSIFSFSIPSSLALDGDTLVAGLAGASEDSYWDGVANVYQYYQGRWVDQLRLTNAEDGGSGSFFGSSVIVRGKNILISAPDEFGDAAYIYEIGDRE